MWSIQGWFIFQMAAMCSQTCPRIPRCLRGTATTSLMCTGQWKRKMGELSAVLTRIYMYRQVSNIRCTLVGNWIVDHSDVVGASSVGVAPTTSSFSTWHMASKYCAKTTASRTERHFKFWDLARLILEILWYSKLRFYGTLNLTFS